MGCDPSKNNRVKVWCAATPTMHSLISTVSLLTQPSPLDPVTQNDRASTSYGPAAAFSDLVGQDSAALLTQASSTETSVLLSLPGPRGLASSARLIAKALNCRNRTADSAEPCGTCNSCRRLSEPDPQWSSFMELSWLAGGGFDWDLSIIQ